MAEVRVEPARLEAASDLVEWTGEVTHGIPFTPTSKAVVGAAFLAIVREHHRAIVILIDQEIYASAFALVRSAFEGYVRGAWISMCATEKQIQHFWDGGKPPGIDELLAVLGKKPEFEDGVLSAMKDRDWATMCDFTHTGGRQVRRFHTDFHIEPNYRLKDVLKVLQTAELIAMMSVVSFALLIDNRPMYEAALGKMREWRGEVIGKDREGLEAAQT